MASAERGYCLVSQQIRGKIRKREIIIPGDLSLDNPQRFSDQGLEGRVQPSPFEPVIGETVVTLDTEQKSVFNPGSKRTVREALLELPALQAIECPSKEFLLQVGYTYLIPLVDKVKVLKGESIRSSPKSSIGRLFPRTRMIADNNGSFDCIHYNGFDDERELWLLVQPTVFNLVLNPGDKLNQLRFFKGTDASLSQQELIDLYSEKPFLFMNIEDEIPVKEPIITDDGLEVNIDLTGSNSNGIVALRARKNPTPIILNRVEQYDAERFFEPVKIERGKIRFQSGMRYLMTS